MNRLPIRYALCLFCLLLPLGAWAQEGISRRAMKELVDPEPIEQKVMQFNTLDATFPKLEETDAPYTVEYTFVNRSHKPLTIDKVTVSCGCMAAAYDKRPVPAGGKGNVKISFSPKGYSGTIYRQAFVYTSLSAELPTARLTLTGEVAPSKDPWRSYPQKLGVLRARQKSVTFKVTNRTGKIAEVIACGNSGDKPLMLSAKGLPPYLKFRTSHSVINPGEEADLIFLFDGALLPMEAKGTLSIPVAIEGVESSVDNPNRIITVIIQFDQSL